MRPIVPGPRFGAYHVIQSVKMLDLDGAEMPQSERELYDDKQTAARILTDILNSKRPYFLSPRDRHPRLQAQGYADLRTAAELAPKGDEIRNAFWDRDRDYLQRDAAAMYEDFMTGETGIVTGDDVRLLDVLDTAIENARQSNSMSGFTLSRALEEQKRQFIAGLKTPEKDYGQPSLKLDITLETPRASHTDPRFHSLSFQA